MGLDTVILAIIIGTLAAIVYSLRILVLLERRISRIDKHIELMTMSVLREEHKIEQEEQHLMSMTSRRSARPARRKKRR
ncbi:MAG TPA: hypothetical protein VJG90_04055 [Candidatus Nanoarchaeia archaeon]|nr:hypothetical protein [Candidatus Nanoarchaeia archaeon]